MSLFETLVGRATRPHACERCADEIAIGALTVFYAATKTRAHLACHLRRRRA